MKKVILFLLVIFTGTGNLFAQIPDKEMREKIEEYRSLNKTEQTFRMSPHYENRKFTFNLRKGHVLIFNFQTLTQVEKVPDIDSVLRLVWHALQPFSDSFSKPLVNRRIDYHMGMQSHTVRLLEYEPKGEVYRMTAGDTTQLKIEQDTLSIQLLTEYQPPSNRQNKFPFPRGYQPMYITLLLNNITDLPSITKEDLDWAVEAMKKDVAVMLAKSKKDEYAPVFGVYNVWEKKKVHAFQMGTPIKQTIPFIQGSFQYVRGGWAPSVGVGMEHSWREHDLRTMYLRLIWEPYFFFNRTIDKKTELDRTDFVTAIFLERMLEEKGSRELDYSLQFTLGYAVRTRGTWFEKNTFKFSLPGFEYRNMMLYPEFNFHDFFKDFNPSMKLVMNFE